MFENEMMSLRTMHALSRFSANWWRHQW